MTRQERRAESKGDSALPTSGGEGKARAPQVPSITAVQMTEVDRRVVRTYGITLLQMMELAGRNLAEQAQEMLGGSVLGRSIVVLCGTGNNGGGGMVAARHLHGWGAEVEAALTGPSAKLKAVPKRQWRILQRLGLSASAGWDRDSLRPDVILDAIFGYGFRGRPPPGTARWIEWANKQTCPVLALDLPSGLDATSGVPAPTCIRAAATLTLALPKTGLRAPDAAGYVGELFLADIGVPPEVFGDLGLEVGNWFDKGPRVRLEER